MKNKSLTIAKVALVIAIMFSACKPEKTETVITQDYKGVYVVNEGGFLKSNGSTGLFKPGTGDYFDAFQMANGRPLGDVVQSMTLINSYYYIVVNNSNKIEVVNQSDFKSVTTISVSQPRGIIKVTDAKAYISQLNSNAMSVLDLNTNTITKTIDVKSPTDNMVLMDGNVYVAKAYADRIYEINTTTDLVVDSVIVGSGVSSIVNLNSSQIGIFCLGIVDFATGNVIENGKIAIVSDSNVVEKVITLNTASFGGAMMYSQGFLYYTFGDGKLFEIPSTAVSGAANPVIEISGSIYGVSADPSNGDIYLTDARDYVSSGKVLVYNNAGVKQKEFSAGIVPSKVVFNY